MKPATNFINPQIASLIEAKNEIASLIEQTKQTEKEINDREDLILNEMEVMAKKMDEFQDQAKKLRKMFKILTSTVIVSFLVAAALYFFK